MSSGLTLPLTLGRPANNSQTTKATKKNCFACLHVWSIRAILGGTGKSVSWGNVLRKQAEKLKESQMHPTGPSKSQLKLKRIFCSFHPDLNFLFPWFLPGFHLACSSGPHLNFSVASLLLLFWNEIILTFGDMVRPNVLTLKNRSLACKVLLTRASANRKLTYLLCR